MDSNNHINSKLLIHGNLGPSERRVPCTDSQVTEKTRAQLALNITEFVSCVFRSVFCRSVMEWHELQIIVMYPLMRKNVIWRWLTLSLIDKGERSPEMIQMARGAAECCCKKPVSAFCYSTARQHLEDKTTPVPLLTSTTGMKLDARHQDNGGMPYGPLFTIIWGLPSPCLSHSLLMCMRSIPV